MRSKARYVRGKTTAWPRHVRGKPARSRHHPLRRAATLLTVALASVFVLASAAFGLSRSGLVHGQAHARLDTSASSVRPGTNQPETSGIGRAPDMWLTRSAGKGGTDAPSAVSGTPGALSPTQAERRACPAAATACVDLKAHLTWLQSGGKVTYGPVRMEPGQPGTQNATPRGRFRVQWKAGPHFVSTEYGDPMPWATFFAPGGIAFHGGSLTESSHGCVHLTDSNAHYFQDHLPIGAEVVVF
jgi:L,D-transpeptidase-like protein